jgi:hypothetical protein
MNPTFFEPAPGPDPVAAASVGAAAAAPDSVAASVAAASVAAASVAAASVAAASVEATSVEATSVEATSVDVSLSFEQPTATSESAVISTGTTRRDRKIFLLVVMGMVVEMLNVLEELKVLDVLWEKGVAGRSVVIGCDRLCVQLAR